MYFGSKIIDFFTCILSPPRDIKGTPRMLNLPSLSWFDFIELGASTKDSKVSCKRILGVMTISLLFSEFDSVTISPNCLVLSLMLSNFLVLGDKDS